jgi:hypothetical protein
MARNSNAVTGSDAQTFLPTVTGHYEEGGTLILETLDSRDETDLVTSPKDGTNLQRKGDLVTEEQREILSLHEKQ